MPAAPIAKNDEDRLKVLNALGILDTPAESNLDSITQLLSEKIGVPIAVIALVDKERQWFKSCVGEVATETAREVSFCSYTILSSEPLVIEDATTDPRTADNALVTGSPGIGAYLGYPITVEGARIGSLCAIALEPRSFTHADILTVELLAKWVEREIVLRDRTLLLNERNRLNKKASRAFANAPYPLMRIGVDGEVHQVNEKANRFWASCLNRVPNLLTDPAIADVDFRAAMLALDEGLPFDLDPVKVSVEDGSHYIQFHMSLDDADGDRSYILGFDDITDSVWASQVYSDVEAETRKLKSQESVDQRQFMVRLSHEMRNPINGMLGVIELVKMASNTISEKNFASLESCVMTLKALVDDTLDLERISQGRISLEHQPFDIARLCDDMAESGRKDVEAKNLKFIYTSRFASKTVQSDQLRLQQIATNLLSNAAKYTHAGEVLFDVNYQNGRLSLTVTDSGEGISEDLQSHVFEPYIQAKESDSDSARGVGLGLAIVKQLVDRMGGTITFDSVLGKGSEFRVEMPLPEAEQELISPSPALDIPELNLSVLVVDDNPINRCVLGAQLNNLGCSVEKAEDGLEALRTLASSRPDLVLLDCHMPGLDGFATATSVRKDPEKYGRPTIVALTASIRPDAEQRCLDSGMDDFLQKPIRFSELCQKLKQYANATHSSER
jgi:signal transduction histidine kinase/CheY-like chemotaxis protein